MFVCSRALDSKKMATTVIHRLLATQFFILLNIGKYDVHELSWVLQRKCAMNVPLNLNFRLVYCLKLSGNWVLLYMKVMKVAK